MGEYALCRRGLVDSASARAIRRHRHCRLYKSSSRLEIKKQSRQGMVRERYHVFVPAIKSTIRLWANASREREISADIGDE